MNASDFHITDLSLGVPDQLSARYADIEGSITVNEQSIRTTYHSPVNFQESMSEPRHRWFPYKEGFSPAFVRGFLQGCSIPSGSKVLDPFSGSGTTCIVSGQLGHEALGLDVSPLTVFVSQAKSLQFDAKQLQILQKTIEEFAVSKLSEVANKPQNATVERYFEENVYEALLKVKYFSETIESTSVRSLFKLAFLNSIEPFSTHRKAGNGVKKKTNYRSPGSGEAPKRAVKDFMIQKLRMFANDIESSSNFIQPTFSESSCIDDATLSGIEGVSALLTSPPYANCFDYSKIYMSELWLGDFFNSKDDQVSFRQSSVRSHVHATWASRYADFGSQLVKELIRPHVDAQDLWSSRIGSMLEGYFSDLGYLLHEMHDKMLKGGKLGFVVGNSFYGGIPIATDLLLADLGRHYGYEVEEVCVYRGVIPSSQQYKRLGENRKYMRESLVILRRN